MEDCRRVPKIDEDCQRLPKIAEECRVSERERLHEKARDTTTEIGRLRKDDIVKQKKKRTEWNVRNEDDQHQLRMENPEEEKDASDVHQPIGTTGQLLIASTPLFDIRWTHIENVASHDP